MIRFIAPTVAVIATLVTIVVASSGLPTSAQADPIVSVDAISDGSNTATAVGTIDTCRSTTTGATFDADIVIQGVTNISGFQANLLYNPAVLKVTAVDYNFLLASTGATSVLPLGNSTPDTDGDFLLAAAMFSFVSVIGANGDGVLARITFQAIGSGPSALDLTNLKLADADGNPILPTDGNNFYIGPVNDASVVVDTTCGSTPGCEPEIDTDIDGFNDDVECFMGTLPQVACAATNTANDEGLPDAWPFDFNDDQRAGIADVLGYIPVFNSFFPIAPYDPRWDLDASGGITLADILSYIPVFNLTCGP